MKYIYLIVSIFMLFSCSTQRDTIKADKYPIIYPDYNGVKIPCNIAPLNFSVEEVQECMAEITIKGKSIYTIKSNNSIISFPIDKWQKVLQTATNSNIEITITAKNKDDRWIEYKPFSIYISSDIIDSHLVYRLIAPGYELWGDMGIYQRDLNCFDESAIIENSTIGKGCVNCHSFADRNADQFMFHLRSNDGGTIINNKDDIKKITLKNPITNIDMTYPMWHPKGRYIAFSSNTTRQSFHAFDKKKVEVYDTQSDIAIYDTEQNTLITDPRFNNDNSWESFPAWSPDGKWLYFSSAQPKDMPHEYNHLHYSILRAEFDANSGTIGTQIDTIINAERATKSALFARISLDNRFLLYTSSPSGTFPIWYSESDLKMLSLETMQPLSTDLWNSEESESYHSFSSNGRWVVFSSRREDGLYTRLYIGHIDSLGNIGKSFLLPQKDPHTNQLSLKSYNIPEFVKSKVTLNGSTLVEKIKNSKATNTNNN